MKNNKTFIISISCIILTFILIGIKAFNNNIAISLNGKDKLILNLKERYVEEGAVAKLCNFFTCKETNNIEIENNINNEKVGEYQVTYTVKEKKKQKQIVRTVNVVDNVKPEINLEGEKQISICPNSEYVENGYKAIDNYDGDLTTSVEIENNDKGIKYIVSDSSNNTSITTREIIHEDLTAPTLTLNGKQTMYLNTGSTYIEPGATAYDECDGDITDKIEIISNVDSNVNGKYTVLYQVTDSLGNIATLNRTIVVRTPIVREPITIPSNITEINEYISYLEQYIQSKNYNVSVGYVNLNTGYTYTYKGDTIYYGASLVKTVAAEYIVENNLLNDSTREKVKKAISISDNSAYLSLVNTIGLNNLREYGRNLGATKFLNRGQNDAFGNTTVNDQIIIWKHLYQLINNHPNGNELKSYFINDYSNHLKFNGAPTTMHKYGYYDVYYHESGIIYSNNPYIVVILTKHGKNNSSYVVSDLSEKIYQLNQLNT